MKQMWFKLTDKDIAKLLFLKNKIGAVSIVAVIREAINDLFLKHK